MPPLPRSLSASLAPGLGSIAVAAALFVASGGSHITTAQPAPASNRVMVRSDVQEADSENGTVTARGNVEIDYPARKIQATAAQAQLFQRENRLVLSGNVVVVQEDNRIRAEQVVYLIEENRFIATPKSSQQVRSVFVIPASGTDASDDADTDATAPPL
ncbi:MAG: LptA/OstA family protein [Cyanobacteria bacterium J06641_5]